MTELVLSLFEPKTRQNILQRLPHFKGFLLLAFIFTLFSVNADLRALTLSTMAEAYLAVSVFVAGTLLLVYSIERIFGFSLSEKMANAGRWQVPMAAFLGALPGCGGAIIVVTQYTKGLISFGSLVAVLISTMGDAAFLILAREPKTGLMLIVVGALVGTISGWLIDLYHGQSFMHGKNDNAKAAKAALLTNSHHQTVAPVDLPLLRKSWLFLFAPGVVLGLLGAFLIEVDPMLASLGLRHFSVTETIGVLGCLLCLVMWAFSRDHATLVGQDSADISKSTPMVKRVIQDTNFVTAWVFMAFIAYELLAHYTGGGISSWMQGHEITMIALAILVGFIPGCGPQIVVASLYLSGQVPAAALFGNAIANDGDALFPAIALAPKAASLATIYSAVPAILVAALIYSLG